MARIAGLKLIKSASGKVTHVTLSMKYHSNILQDMVDLADIKKARKGDTVDWSEAKAKINKKHKLKS
jgi:hypothetical protein